MTERVDWFGYALACLMVLGLLVLVGVWTASVEAEVDRRVPALYEREAANLVRGHAGWQRRPDFRVESMRRLSRYRWRVCWSEPGYLGPDDGRDYGCDLAERRGYRYWIKDDSTGGSWVRWP